MKIKKPDVKKLTSFMGKYKYVLLIIALGAGLMLIPRQSGETISQTAAAEGTATEEYSITALQSQIEAALEQISGAGDCTLVLTLKSSTEKVLAVDKSGSTDTSQEDGKTSVKEESQSETVIISGSDGGVEVIKTIYPQFQGALVVSEGAGSAEVRLKLINALSNLTGLGADRITVEKMKSK